MAGPADTVARTQISGQGAIAAIRHVREVIFQVPYPSPDPRLTGRRMLRELVVVEEGYTDEPFGSARHSLVRSLLAPPRLHQ